MSVLYAISDTHGDTQNYIKLLELTKDADVYAHLGDYLRDGNKLKDITLKPTYAVKGNGDFSGGELEEIINVGGMRVLLTHGHRYGVKSGLMQLMYRALELECSAAVYGHTHIPDITFQNGVYLICPGTLSGAGTRVCTYARIEAVNNELRPCLYRL